jgi:hypothetical protein
MAAGKTGSPTSSPVLAAKRTSSSSRSSSAAGAAAAAVGSPGVPHHARDNDLRNSDQPASSGVSLFGSSAPSHTILLAGTGTGGGALRKSGSAKGQQAAAAGKSPLTGGNGGAGNARARYGATTATSPTASTAWP